MYFDSDQTKHQSAFSKHPVKNYRQHPVDNFIHFTDN